MNFNPSLKQLHLSRENVAFKDITFRYFYNNLMLLLLDMNMREFMLLIVQEIYVDYDSVKC